MADYQSRALDWGDEIANRGAGAILEPGDYPFTVTGFTAKSFNGSDRMAPCPIAEMTLDVDGGEQGVASVKAGLFLSESAQGDIFAFFRSLGLRPNESGRYPIGRRDFEACIGMGGRCRVKLRDWKGNDGSVRKAVDVDTFLAPMTPELEQRLAAARAQVSGQPQQTQGLGF